MIVLDTDLLTVIQTQSGDSFRRLDERLQQVFETETVAVTIVSLHEQTRGWLAFLNNVTSKNDGVSLIVGYDRLRELFADFQDRTILDFDKRALEKYNDLRKRRIRIGTMDLRIAAIVLANSATLLTRNVRDFSKVPGLKVEDWSV